jgi:hypothetical protein
MKLLNPTLRLLLLAGATLLSLSGFADAGKPDFDFEQLMEDVELELNEMQASISLEDDGDAILRAGRLAEAFKLIEDFFAGWGYADDAVLSSQQYQERARRVIALVEAGRHNEAYDVSVEFSQHCKACHDNYKPLPL